MTSKGSIRSRVAMRVFKRRVAFLRALARNGIKHRSKAYLAVLGDLDRRSRGITILMTVIAALLAYRAGFVSLSPTYRMRAALVTANMQPAFMDPLMGQVRQLQKLSADIEKTSLGDLRSALEATAVLTERATKEFETQYASWSVLRGQIKNDGSTYDALRKQLDEMQKVQAQEIVRWREALDKAAKPSVWSDIWTQALTFMLGVLSSILATFVWERWPALRLWWNAGQEKRFPDPPDAKSNVLPKA